ncbi:MAG TPA: 3'-5' exonuclease [Clostridiales bacterium]|nr:3'-5' exonuclease [Clostridiales bacterium]
MSEQKFLQLRKQVLDRVFDHLNTQQKAAVFYTEGPVLVLAGAGSGKTTVIVNRIAYLIRYGTAYHSAEIPADITQEILADMAAFSAGKLGTTASFDEKIAVNPVKPWQILAITFTNKAANELKERCEALLGEQVGDIWASTFHAMCTRILRRHAADTGFSSHFTIYDTDDSKKAAKQAMQAAGIDEKMIPVKTVLNEISRAKDILVSPAEYLEANQWDYRLSAIGRVYAEYQRMLACADAMDFDDIIVNTVKLLRSNEEIREQYRNQFRYVLVDEYQDTNHAQYILTSLLTSNHNNLFVVGDDDQSIYKFRGAVIENILDFEKRYRGVKIIRLEQNYRSTQNILHAANEVIKNNSERKGKKLWTENAEGEKIFLHTFPSEQDESAFIAATIENAAGSGSKLSDFAILYRLTALSNSVEYALIRNGIAYRIIGGRRFYERAEIRVAIAYLSVINNPSDNIRLLRIINEPKRGIGSSAINQISAIADGLGVSLFEVIRNASEYPVLAKFSKHLRPFADMIEELSALADKIPLNELYAKAMELSAYPQSLSCEKNYEDRLENLHELFTNLINYTRENENASLNGFLEEVALLTDIDHYNSDSDTVTLMTVHTAKGLEFQEVFLIGMEEGIFPGSQSMYQPQEIEEERRLAYVGITRAKRKLYVTNAYSRQLFGKTTYNPPSRFVKEIPAHLTQSPSCTTYAYTGAPRKTAAGASGSVFIDGSAKTKQTQPDYIPEAHAALRPGDIVTHKMFGRGLVLSVEKAGNDFILEVAFDKAGTKKLMANYAKLEKL